MMSLALLILRVTVGGLLVGHGAQKLFGYFGGHGVEGTAGWLESLNLRPGREWAVIAGLSEFAGGVLTVLGALNPLGPIIAMGSMLMATLKVHQGKPIWVTSGGAELPVTNMAVLATLFVAGAGRLSFDGLLGIRVPRWFSVAALAGMLGVTYLAATQSGLGDEIAVEGPADEVEAGMEVAGGESNRIHADVDDVDGDRQAVGSWGAADPGEPEPLLGEDAGTIAAVRPGDDA